MSQLALFLLEVAALFVLLLVPARRAMAGRWPRGVSGWMLRMLGSVALLVATGAAAVGIESARARGARFAPAVEPLAIPDDSAALARGAHLADVLGCRGCHGPDLAGTVFFDEPGVARLVAPDLTGGAGGVGAAYGDEDFVRALRYGVRKSGQALFAMPTKEFHSLADADVASVIAWVRRRPPVPSTLPETHIGWLGKVGIATGKYRPSREELAHAAPRPATAPSGLTVEHGRYLAHAICTECHADSGPVGPVRPGEPPHLDVLAGYEVPELTRAVREAVARDGRKLSPMMSPARQGRLTDEEIAALQLYLRSRLSGRT